MGEGEGNKLEGGDKEKDEFMVYYLYLYRG